MTQHKYVRDRDTVSQSKVEKLMKKVAKTMVLEEEVALALIYKEWDRIEVLFEKYKKVKTVHTHLIDEIDGCYRS
jgi:tRNA(His) 5'-end guanylyltransferase